MREHSPTLSVVVPVFNEAPSILEIIRRIRAVPDLDIELIVVDDCSTDGTRDILSEAREQIDHLILKERNGGKGSAVRMGFAAATGKVTVVQDADLEYDPQEYARLIGPIVQGHADVVYGSRFQGGGPHRVLYFWHYAANVAITLLSNMCTNLNLSDMETGHKAFATDCIKNLPLTENGFGFEPEITARLAKRQARFFEVGISYHGRTYKEGKKISARDAFWAVYCILRYNLFPGSGGRTG